jgi:uncharacterized protein YggT (Ycf19 family)
MSRFSPLGLIDLILNVACVLLWINWHSRRLVAGKSSVMTLASTLKKAEPRRGRAWLTLVMIPVLLALRTFFYWKVGAAVNWIPSLQLGVISLSFRSDYFIRILLFSILSFAVALGGFYIWLLLISVINRKVPTDEPFQRLVRLHLGWIERWPATAKLLLPLFLGCLLWGFGSRYLVRLGIVPSPISTSHVWQQATLVGLSSYFAWKSLLLLVCLLYLLNSYVYLGNSYFWQYVNVTGANLLHPFRRLPVCIGKIDLSPLICIGLVFAVAHWAARCLTQLFQRLPL